MNIPWQKKSRAYLQMSRLSNLPTVWSNVLVGLALAGATPIKIGWHLLLFATLSCYYLGGMFFNDACDSQIDRQQRPERPIPSGIVGTREAYSIGVGLLLLANILLGTIGAIGPCTVRSALLVWGVSLTLAIVGYNCWHKKYPSSVMLMALCRFGTYAIACYAAPPAAPIAWGAPLLVSVYILGITWIARQETSTKLAQRWPLLLLFSPALFAGIKPASCAVVIPLALATGWVAYCVYGICSGRYRISRFIGFLLAAISLWDALFLTALGWYVAALLAACCFTVTLAAHKIIPGT